jgi:hypothetical protein
MSRPFAAALVFVVLLASLRIARATCNGPTCSQVGIVSGGCQPIEGTLSSVPLYLSTDCESYCDPQVGPDGITNARLAPEVYRLVKIDAQSQDVAVEGAFVRDGACGESDRLRFEGTLEPDTQYQVRATVSFTSLILEEFRTAPADEFDDGTGCSVAPMGRGGAGAPCWLLLLIATLALRRRR